MGIKVSKKKSIFIILGLAFLGLPLFQNCSKIGLQPVTQQLDNQVSFSIDGADANSMFYTNSRTISLNLIVQTDMLDQVRVSTNADMEKAQIPWQSVSGKIIYDLNDEYAFDGSKDGIKTIYLELRNSLSDQLAKRVSKSIQVFLDTQGPEIDGEELLTKGVQGTVFKKAQSVPIKWNMTDRKPATGQSSGLHPDKGVRWGYSHSNDCSESELYEKIDWRSPVQNTTISWPTNDPLDVFYICLFAKDRAGNTNTFLSQPMTSLWNVVAGENSQGNGASVMSQKVRFKSPDYLALAPNGDLRVRDLDFNSWRNIGALQNDPSRIISSMTVPLFGDSNMLYDRAGNAYMVRNSDLFVVKVTDPSKAVKIVSTPGVISTFAIRNYLNTERIVFSFHRNAVSADPTAESFLFEVPIKTLLSSASFLDYTDLKANYKIAGNGVIPPMSYSMPTGVTLSSADPVDLKYSIGRVYSMTTGSAGEIFITNVNFANSTVGNRGARRLTPQANGTFLQDVLPGMTEASRQMSYMKKKLKDGIVHDILLVSSANEGAVVYDFAQGKRLNPFPLLKGHYSHGALIVPSEDNSDFSFYISSVTTSQIFIFDSSYKLIQILGRPVHDEITNPLAAIIGNVDGIVKDFSDETLYFLDSQNALLRKIDSSGSLKTVAGKLQNFAAKNFYNAEPLGDYLINTADFMNYRYQLAADFDLAKNRKMIYIPLITGQVQALDLVNNKVDTLLKPTGPYDRSLPKYWANQAVAFAKAPNDKNALLTTKIEKASSGRYLNTGFVHLLPVEGDFLWQSDAAFMGDINNLTPTKVESVVNNLAVGMSNDLPGIVVDSQGLVFVSGPDGLRVSSLVSTAGKTRILPIKNISAFGIVEEGTKRHLIYASGTALAMTTLETDKIFDPASTPIVALAQKLCLSGTTLQRTGQIIRDTDGNLLITDSKNARILKYRIRDAKGILKWTTTCP